MWFRLGFIHSCIINELAEYCEACWAMEAPYNIRYIYIEPPPQTPICNEFTISRMIQLWTLPFLCLQPPAPTSLLSWMITHCLHNDLVHFYEVECQPFRVISLIVLMRTPASQFRVQRKMQNHCRVAWNVNVKTFLSPQIVDWKDAWFKRQAPSRVQSLTLECALSMSHNVAVTLGWYLSTCLWVSHSFHSRLQRWFTLATTNQSGFGPKLAAFIQDLNVSVHENCELSFTTA